VWFVAVPIWSGCANIRIGLETTFYSFVVAYKVRYCYWVDRNKTKKGEVIVLICIESEPVNVFGRDRKILRLLVDHRGKIEDFLKKVGCGVVNIEVEAKQNVARFITVDDYEQSGFFVHRVKYKDDRYIRYSIDEFPEELCVFDLCRHSDAIENGRDELAILIRPEDHKNLIRYALIRAKWLNML